MTATSMMTTQGVWLLSGGRLGVRCGEETRDLGALLAPQDFAGEERAIGDIAEIDEAVADLCEKSRWAAAALLLATLSPRKALDLLAGISLPDALPNGAFVATFRDRNSLIVTATRGDNSFWDVRIVLGRHFQAELRTQQLKDLIVPEGARWGEFRRVASVGQLDEAALMIAPRWPAAAYLLAHLACLRRTAARIRSEAPGLGG